MHLRPEQLDSHLRDSELAPIYFISGDEALGVMEAADAVRARCRDQGYTERVVIDVELNFDWNVLAQEVSNLSLFAERRLIDLRLRHYKPGRDGAPVLTSYAARVPEATVLLITADKQDKSAVNTKWYKALNAAGVTLQVWPMDAGTLPEWLVRRADKQGCRLSREAARLVAERTEGNMLAAAQEIDKLALLHPDQVVDADMILNAVSDSARYDVFAFADAAISGDAARACRTLSVLRAEGEPAVLLSWALTRELRAMCRIAFATDTGRGIEQAMASEHVMSQRKRLVQKAIGRHVLRAWQSLLRRSIRIEQTVKGRRDGNAWDELLRVALLIAGVRTVKG